VKALYKKYRQYFNITACLVFGILSFIWLKKYISEGKKAGLWLGILFLITACIKIWDTVETYRNNRKL